MPVRWNASTLQRISQSRHEIIEQFIINFAALRMILHSKSERVIAQFYLFDDVVSCAPGLNRNACAQFIDCLMMGAIHFFKTMSRLVIGAEWLNIVRLLIRQIVTG